MLVESRFDASLLRKKNNSHCLLSSAVSMSEPISDVNAITSAIVKLLVGNALFAFHFLFRILDHTQ